MKTIISLSLMLALPCVAFAEMNKSTEEQIYTYHLRPTLLEQSSAGSFVGGVDFSFLVEKKFDLPTDNTFTKSALGNFDLRGLLISDSNSNPRPLTVLFGAGVDTTIGTPKTSEQGKTKGKEIITQDSTYYGSIQSTLNIGYETDQAWDNRDLTAGAKLGYGYTQPKEWHHNFIPSFFAAYDYVIIDKSKMQEQLGVEGGDYNRAMVAASWKLPIGKYGKLMDCLPGLSLHFDLRFYQDLNRAAAIENADKDQAHYFACSLNYTFKEGLWGKLLTGMYIQFNDGRIPPATDGDTQVFLGLILWESPKNEESLQKN